MACREVKLKEVGGDLAGVNQVSSGLGTGVGYYSEVDHAGLTQEAQAFWTSFDTLPDDQKLQDWQTLSEDDQQRLRMDQRIQTWWEANVR
jgi:hypothetical protein